MSFRFLDGKSQASGDLGRSNFIYSVPGLRDVFHAVGDILSKLPRNRNMVAFFAIEFSLGDFANSETLATQFISDLEQQELPEGVGLFDIDGRYVFGMRGADGGIVTSYICYIIQKYQ